MIKKLWILFFLTFLVLNLVGCSGGSYRITIGEINSLPNSITGNYNSFSGYYYKKIKIKEGQTLSATFTVNTEKGQLSAKVIDSNGKTIKTLNSGETANLNQPGQYKLQVEGEQHKGSFTLSWKIE